MAVLATKPRAFCILGKRYRLSHSPRIFTNPIKTTITSPSHVHINSILTKSNYFQKNKELLRKKCPIFY